MAQNIHKYMVNESILALKTLIANAADDFFVVVVAFLEKIMLYISYESSAYQMIHMKCQVLFSYEKYNKQNEYCPLQFCLG